MTLEESKEVIPMMEAMITQIEGQQNIMAEMLQEIQEKDEKLMCFQEQEERLQQLEKELSELLQILPDTEELLMLLEEKADQIQRLTDENQQWQELAQKLNSENRLLQKQNSELLKMIEYENSKSDDQLEELLLLTEQMQEELDQKDRTIEELKVQLDESLTLNERLNSENRAGNIQALKNDLRKTKELLQSEKEKTLTAKDMIKECRDKLRQTEQERDYALSHQKKVEIPVEKSVLYQKCRNCNQTAYLKAKERYDTQREKMAGRYKAKTAMYEALMFLLIWYSASTTLFQMIQSKVFISDCRIFFGAIGTFTQTIAGWIALIGKNVAQISNGISNPVIAGIIYWLIRILICGGCLVGAGILVAFIGIKIAGLYKKYCWDMITILVTLISLEIAIYFGDWIKTVLPINMLFLLLLVQLVYVGIRWYVKGWQEARGYY